MFSDLVAAYKSQIKENETLQATVKSLRAAAARRNQQPQNSLSLEEDGGAEISNEEVLLLRILTSHLQNLCLDYLF